MDASHFLRRPALLAGALVALATCVPADRTRADLFGLGLLGPQGNSVSDKQQTIQSQSADMLQQLYALKPELQDVVKNAAGYATFKKTDVKLFLVASGTGYGLLHNNTTGQDTYMDVASLGGGVGMGVSDLRVIFIFTDPAVMNQFLTQGFQFGAGADANAQLNNTGVSASQSARGSVDFNDGTVDGGGSASAGAGGGDGNTSGGVASSGSGMLIYQFTQSGLALQATVSGTKYWVDSELNN
ncbi:MAG: hypothetical protein JSS51_06120 [Planctomycetes bacterium]|nr:hypothetical protein [Planctomycetota bacterium]